VLRFSVGISLTAVMGTIIVQLDKLVLVSMTDLEEFGFYSICSAAGLALLQLVYPITRSAYPEGAKLLAAGKSLSELNERVLVMISILVLPVGVVLCVFSQEILYLWTQNINLINFGSVILRILVLGTLLNVYYNLPYMNWLLCGEYKRPLLTNFVAMLVVLVCIVPLIKVFGAEGAALCWVIANLFCLFIGWLWMIRNGHFSLEKCINAMLVAIGYFSIALAVKYMISSYLAIFITLVIFLILGYSLAKYSLLRRKNISRN
jgi:O-antigen/teichoic acid export membrane protein